MAQDENAAQDRPQDPPGVPARQPGVDELALRRRVSDLEREDVAEVLRAAAGDGRLSFAELEERLETAYAAKTFGELVEVTADLPGGPSAPTTPVVPDASRHPSQYPPHDSALETAPAINAFLSDTKRTGAWVVPQRQEINSVLGDVTLDYTEAQVPYDVVYLDIKVILAAVKIRVPENAIVHLESSPILGSVGEESGVTGPPAPGSPPPKTFHIRGTAVLGDIKIKRGPGLRKRLGLA